MNMYQIFEPGDIVEEISSGRQREVVDVWQDLLKFDDSHLVGWSKNTDWKKTGKSTKK